MIQTLIKGTLALALATAIIRPAAAADTVYVSGVVNFDSLPNSSGGVHMPTTYEGFTWGNDLYSITRTGTENDYVAFTLGGGRTIFRTDQQPFYFDSADFFLRPGASPNDCSFVLYGKNSSGNAITLYNGLTEKYGRNQVILNEATPQGTLQTFQSITKDGDGKAAGPYTGLIYGMAIAFDNTGYTDLGMDNLRFRAAAPSPSLVTSVPEPKSFTMMLAGVTAMGAVIYTHRKAAQS